MFNSIDGIFRHYKQTYPSVDVISVVFVFVFSIEGFVPVPWKCVLGTGRSFRTGRRDIISGLELARCRFYRLVIC